MVSQFHASFLYKHANKLQGKKTFTVVKIAAVKSDYNNQHYFKTIHMFITTELYIKKLLKLSRLLQLFHTSVCYCETHIIL